jgi:hypothetical protein
MARGTSLKEALVGASPTSSFRAVSEAQTLPSQRATPQTSVLSAQSYPRAKFEG